MFAQLLRFLVVEMIVAGIVNATVIRVPEDQPTIQKALNVAVGGDTVLVAPGTYYENIIWPSINGIKLIGSGQNQTIIDGGRLASVIRIGEKRNETIDTKTVISNLTIRNGFAHAAHPGSHGGGIFILYSSPTLKLVTIKDNIALYEGGGIWCQESNPYFSGVTITENSASWEGGGIKLIYSRPEFDQVKRCNIYFNSAGIGSDLFNTPPNGGPNVVILDTFTVLTPIDHHAFPTFSFSFNILNGKVSQVNAGLFVSPNGNDTNSGLSNAKPLKCINTALAKILAHKASPHTIFLADGLYSRSTTGQLFPLNCENYVSILGTHEKSVILDAENYTVVTISSRDSSFTIKDLTIQNGFGGIFGGGITCIESTPIINQATIRNNTALFDGGGIFLSGSTPILSSISIIGNKSDNNGGGIFARASNMSIVDATFAFNNGGGFYVSGGTSLKHGIIRTNQAQNGGGAFIRNGSFNTVSLTIADNVANQHGSGFHCNGSFSASLENTIVWGETPQEIYLGYTERRFSAVTFSYSDIQSLLNVGMGQASWLDGNISADALFCSSRTGDYTLAANSPCLGTGRDGVNMGTFGLGCSPVAVRDQISNSPAYFILHQNYPNPFNPTTSISFQLPKPSFVNSSIYDVTGQVIEVLINEKVGPGYHSVEWEANKYVSGVYYYTIKAGEYSATRKALFIK